MFSHVMIGTNDLDKAKSFYDALLGTLGVPPGRVDRHRIFYRTKTGVFSVSLPVDGKPATHANGGTIGFSADSAEQADTWHATGIANGATTCEDPPGVRAGSHTTRARAAAALTCTWTMPGRAPRLRSISHTQAAQRTPSISRQTSLRVSSRRRTTWRSSSGRDQAAAVSNGSPALRAGALRSR